MATPVWDFDFSNLNKTRKTVVPLYNRDTEKFEFDDVIIEKNSIANGAYAIVLNCHIIDSDPANRWTPYIVRVFQSELAFNGHREAIFAEYCAKEMEKATPKQHSLNLGPRILRRYKVKPTSGFQTFFDDVMRMNKSVNGSLNHYNYLELDIMEKLTVTLHEFLVSKGLAETEYHLTFVNLKRFVVNENVITNFIKKLDAMHDNLVVHCDLHSKNIMCTLDNYLISELHVIDYGLGMFNDRISEPRFEPFNMNKIFDHSKRMTSLFLPSTVDYELSVSDIVQNVENFDSWFLEGLHFSKTFEVSRWDSLISKIPQQYRDQVPAFADQFGRKKNPKRMILPGRQDFTGYIPLPAPNPIVVDTTTEETLNLFPFHGKRIIDLDKTRKRLVKPKQIVKVLTEYHKYFEEKNFKKTIDDYVTQKALEWIDMPEKEQEILKDILRKRNESMPELLEVAKILYQNSVVPTASQLKNIESYPKMNYVIKPSGTAFNFFVFGNLVDFFIIKAIERINSL